jgi:hypothetical protein
MSGGKGTCCFSEPISVRGWNIGTLLTMMAADNEKLCNALKVTTMEEYVVMIGDITTPRE